MQSTTSFSRLLQKPINKKTDFPSQGTSKLKLYLQEHARLTQLNPLSKLLNKPTTNKYHIPIISPIAAKINSFDNEDSFSRLLQKPINKKTDFPSQGTSKLKLYLQEHASLTQLNPLSKLLNKPTTNKYHTPIISPIAAKINSFDNEDSILQQQSQSSNITEEELDDINDNDGMDVLECTGQKCRKPIYKNNSTNSPKHESVSKVPKPLLQTYKYSNRNSIGTRKLNRFYQEFSQESWNKSPSNVSNVPDQKNTISSTTNTSKKHRSVTHDSTRRKNSFRTAKTNSLLDSCGTSSKIICKKNILPDYFKETRNIKRSFGKGNLTKASGIVCLDSSSSDICNCSFPDDNLVGCARTKTWVKKDLPLLGKEGKMNDNKNEKNIVGFKEKNRKDKCKSTIWKGLDFIEEFDKEYNKTVNKSDFTEPGSKSPCSSSSDDQKKYQPQKLDHWLKNSPFRLNTNSKADIKNRPVGNTVKRKREIPKLTSSSSFKSKSRLKSSKRSAEIYRKIPRQNVTICNDNNLFTNYFLKNKLVCNKESNLGYNSCNLEKRKSGRIDCKNKETGLTRDRNEIQIGTSTELLQSKKPIDSQKGFKNSNFRKNYNSKSQTNSTNHTATKKKIRENISVKESVELNLKPERKTQKNLYSSEGFFESMSLESPMTKINGNKSTNPTINNVEKNTDLLKTENSQTTGFRKKNSILDSEKFKEISSFIQSLDLQPEKSTQKSERRKLTPSEERELSPSHYVMKMCGPESEAIVKSILNSHKNEEEIVNSFNKNDKNLSEENSSCIDHNDKNFNIFDKYIRSKDSPSDPLSFGSPNINFSQNPICSQSSKVPTLANRQTKEACKNSQITQTKEKLHSQTLYKLHGWPTQEQTKNFETLNKKDCFEKNLNQTESFTQITRCNTQDNKLKHQPKGISETNLAAQETLLSPEIFGTQGVGSSLEFIDNISPFPARKNDSFVTKIDNSQVANDIKYVPTHKEEARSPLHNSHNDQFHQELVSHHFEKTWIKKCKNSIPKVEINKAQIDEYHVQTVKITDSHNKTTDDELEIVSKIQPQVECFTETSALPGTQNTNKKLKRTYNLSEDCILYKDNLLKSLVEEDGNDWKITGKKKKLTKKSSEEQLQWGRSYMKRYKKGNTKIFKLKRRIKEKDANNCRPPESQIMDRFLKKFNNDFEDECSTDSTNNDGDESVSTPVSYKTDETKSEVFSTGSSKLTNTEIVLRRSINKLSKDKSLLFSKLEDQMPSNFDKNEILANIEHILNTVLDDFKQGKNPFFRVPKEGVSNCYFADGRYQMKEPPDYVKVSYKLSASRPKFNLILFMLNKIKKLLEMDTKLTKRELYYQLKTMINSQRTTDRALKDISRMLNVGMWALNITAQKGLVYGNLKLVMADGETLNCNVPGTLIPQDISKICEVQSMAYFILVVEKESIFHKLLEENLPNKLTRPFILITGKGFPDLNTQLFLKKLWMILSIPVFILVDADPDGIAIMLTYRFGSIANAHISNHLAIPKAKWLGVFPSEISRLTLSQENLNKREISMIKKLLQSECVQENENIKMQLDDLLENGIKTGIEGLMKTETYLSNSYLTWKFFTNNLI